ncbi:hypothetical protein D3C85_759700 [compost metagenome]
MVGAPNTPRSTASCVTALRRSFTSCAPASASRPAASKPAFCKTAPTVAGSFRFFGSTHIAWNTASMYAPKRSGIFICTPVAPRISSSVLIGKCGLCTKGTP